MKYVFFLLCSAILGLTAFKPQLTTVLSGKVIDKNGEALIGASIKVAQKSKPTLGTVTDANGKYRIELEPGVYELEFSYTGYETLRLIDVQVHAGQVNTVDATLNNGTVLNEIVVVSGYVTRQPDSDKAPAELSEVVVKRKSEARRAGRAEKEKTMPAVKTAAPAGEPAPTTTPAFKPTSVVLDDLRSKESGIAIEKDVYKKPEVYDYLNADEAHVEDVAEEAPVMDGPTTQPSPRAGLLTAGEWNDLHNWSKHWVDLLNDGEIDAYQKMYQFYPKNRYSVLLQNEQELPVSDAEIRLLDAKGMLVWEARTDNMGRAELWNGMTLDVAAGSLSILAVVDGKKHELGKARPFAEGLNRYKIQRECKHSNNLDIVWAVDATGSMGDELEYLKTELLDVIGRVKAANPDLAVRMGSVFYRDKGDDYLVKSSALNYDIAKTVDYIRQQSAGGGGDYPEAVHSALEEAIYRQPWSSDAVARICFLVLDASPHQEPEVIESLQKSIRDAAKRGIRIVPVSASGIQKDTEFLMKFFGLATNGTYVFLTDHSGIGGKHLEPTTDEYKVELLNDLLVRLISEYASMPSCEGKSTIRFEEQQAQTGQQQQGQQQGTTLEPITYYPNPASTQFTLELPFDADKVTLYDAEGKAVRTFAQLAAGTHAIPVNDLYEGFYTLRIWKGNQVQSGKVVVVRA